MGEEHLVIAVWKWMTIPAIAIIGGVLRQLWKANDERKAAIKENNDLIKDLSERMVKQETKVKGMEKDHEGFDEKFNKINEKIDTLLERMADVQAFMKQGS